MGMLLKTIASDGHEFDTYIAQPNGTPLGGLVIIQEIFGLNNHIKSIADRYACEGYLVTAPALFDRIDKGIELNYESKDIIKGRDLKNATGDELPLKDIDAARSIASAAGKVGIIGFCWGGTLAWLAACKVPGFTCASSYYGGGIAGLISFTAKCPVIFHFGRKDQAIPPEEVEIIRVSQPDNHVYLYPAGHGFNCDKRRDFEPTSSKIAEERTLEFLKKNLA